MCREPPVSSLLRHGRAEHPEELQETQWPPLFSTLWGSSHLWVRCDPFCVLPPHHLLPLLLKHNKYLCSKIQSPSPQIHLALTHSARGSVVQPQHSHVLFSRTREQMSDSHRLTKLLKSCVQMASALLPAVAALWEHWVHSRISHQLPHVPPSLPQAKPWANRWALPHAWCSHYEQQRQRLHTPRFEVNSGYNLSLDPTLNLSSSWRQWGAHATSRAACLAASPLCPSVLLVGQGCAPL